MGVIFDSVLGRLRSSSVVKAAAPPLILSSAPTASTVGVLGQVALDTNTSTPYTCIGVDEVSDPAVYTWRKDVIVNGHGLIDAALLPVATSTGKGGVRVSGSGGTIMSGEYIKTDPATDNNIDARSSLYKAIGAGNLDYAVRSVLLNVTEIPAATTAYSLLDAGSTLNGHSWNYVHTPTAVPTYTLPAVSDGTVAHEIVLEVFFTGYVRSSDDDSGSAYAWKNGTALVYTDTDAPAVMQTKVYSDAALTTQTGTVAAYDSAQDAISLVASVSFLDSGGSPLAPRRAVSISPGTIIDYYCRWCPSSGSWKILPVVLS